MTEPWTPFGLNQAERDTYEVLIDGVPEWLREPLLAWIRPRLLTARGDVSAAICLDLQLATRVDLRVTVGRYVAPETLVNTLRLGIRDVELLRVVDYLVSTRYGSDYRDALETTLSQARSKWTVGQRLGRFGLVERVPAGVQDHVEAVIASSSTAGHVLARAWAYVHGLTANDSGAYSDAVRAVEIAAISVVQPRHAEATLGTVLGQMKADGDWSLPLRQHADAPSAEMLLMLLRTLWFGHRDRHGSVDYSDVTHDEARAAVGLAATLVDWFASGAIARRSGA